MILCKWCDNEQDLVIPCILYQGEKIGLEVGSYCSSHATGIPCLASIYCKETFLSSFLCWFWSALKCFQFWHFPKGLVVATWWRWQCLDYITIEKGGSFWSFKLRSKKSIIIPKWPWFSLQRLWRWVLNPCACFQSDTIDFFALRAEAEKNKSKDVREGT